MVHEPKKAFYKKFLYEPFPVESSLADNLPDHFNAEAGLYLRTCSRTEDGN
jgi:activating signal cointegrator complex subunit 3